MQIRLLGTVDVRGGGTVDVDLDDRPLKLAGPKQRAVLSMLALSANTTVSVERLVEGLWGEEPPPTAAKMVQQYVSQLRRLLPENGAARIATHGRGYELQVDPAAVDALRFERLVALAADGNGDRGELAREALALWHGAPLAGMLEEPFAAAEVRRLEELHLAATELALEDDLDAGRHGEAIGRLRALVDEHPLRERLRALLMLALYRAGRQAEALDVFRDARYTLVETLGLEPGTRAAPPAGGDPAPGSRARPRRARRGLGQPRDRAAPRRGRRAGVAPAHRAARARAGARRRRRRPPHAARPGRPARACAGGLPVQGPGAVRRRRRGAASSAASGSSPSSWRGCPGRACWA